MSDYVEHGEKVNAYLMELTALSPMGYAIGLHIRNSSPTLTVQTYPPAWLERYVERGYALCDPVVSWAFGNTGWTRWSELEMPDPHKILEQGRAFGLHYGVIISLGDITSRSLGGFARSDREFSDAEIEQLFNIMQDLHSVTTPSFDLTAAQKVALDMIAMGYRYAEASEVLGISESGLKARIKAARQRMGARTTAEAVQKARDAKILKK